MNTVLKNTTILLVYFLINSSTLGQIVNKNDVKLSPMDTITKNLSSDGFVRMNPTVSETALHDEEIWGNDSRDINQTLVLFPIRPSSLGFDRNYTHREFLSYVLNKLGLKTPPKWLAIQFYMESHNLGEEVNFSTKPITWNKKKYNYAVGPNPKGSTPTKNIHDLFLKPIFGKMNNNDVWIFVKEM